MRKPKKKKNGRETDREGKRVEKGKRVTGNLTPFLHFNILDE